MGGFASPPFPYFGGVLSLFLIEIQEDLLVGHLRIDTYGVDEAWYFTNAIAASSLQNSSRTMTPSSNVMWSTLEREEKGSVKGYI